MRHLTQYIHRPGSRLTGILRGLYGFDIYRCNTARRSSSSPISFAR